MQRKKMTFNIQGMNRDLSKQRFDPKMAYEIHNMRLIATDEEHTTFALTTEKGNEEVTYSDNTFDLSHYGTPVGLVETNDGMVIFFHNTTRGSLPVGDYRNSIIEFTVDSDTNDITPRILYRESTTTLNLDVNHPIEALFSYEAENIRKIYWVDGINQPRMINIDEPVDSPDKMDFVGELELSEDIQITKNETGGLFAPGVIQYSFTYFNARGAESNIFYTSPLYYTTAENRGGKADETTTNSFTISMSYLDTKYKSVRIYSFLRTSLNGEGQAKLVAELNISSSGTLTYTDKGIYGETIDPTKLLYIGGEDIIAGTIAQKDNTLFLGNITQRVPQLSTKDTDVNHFIGNIRDNLVDELRKRDNINFEYTEGQYYTYTNQLKGENVRTLKSREFYRFGVQLQHKSGKWSNPLYIISDVVNNTPTIKTDNPFQSDLYLFLPTKEYYIDDTQTINHLRDLGYVAVRPVIAYPNEVERNCVTQGIVCPTVFNLESRYNKTCFSQTSWFARPLSRIPLDYSWPTDKTDEYWNKHFRTERGFTYEFKQDFDILKDLWSSHLNNSIWVLKNNYPGTELYHKSRIESSQYGQWSVFEHHTQLPDSLTTNCEIHCTSDYSYPSRAAVHPYMDEEDITENCSKEREKFYIDNSIVTLHSPEAYFIDNKILKETSIKFRIIGKVPINSQYSDMEVIINNSDGDPNAIFKGPVTSKLNSIHAWKHNLTNTYWKKGITSAGTSYPLYVWHKTGSINNSSDSTLYTLKEKVHSSMQYSIGTEYDNKADLTDIPLLDFQHVTDKEQPNLLPYSGIEDKIFYKSSIDTILTCGQDIGYRLGTDNSNVITDFANFIDYEEDTYEGFTSIKTPTQINNDFNFLGTYAHDPVVMKYNTTPHIVLSFGQDNNHHQYTLPSNKEDAYTFNIPGTQQYFWESSKTTLGYYSPARSEYKGILANDNIAWGGYLNMGELYRETITEPTREPNNIIENLNWYVAGHKVELATGEDLIWMWGDSYYQRFDCLRTYPYANGDQNSVIETISYMVETRINLDGRTDNNRGIVNLLGRNPENFNLRNPVYSQDDNYFNYRVLDEDEITTNIFPNTITWTLSKTYGSMVDNWTTVTLANTLDLDGDRGEVRALRLFNNNLLSFQDKGISQILYNEQVQIPTGGGVPIEISNSGKVQGKRYISSHGTTNKWSICTTAESVYFVDDITKDIFALTGEGLINISDKNGFHTYVVNNIDTGKIWTPTDFNKCTTTYYDRRNNEVMFTNNSDCLVFSENLGTFTEFISRENVPFLGTIKDRMFTIKSTNNSWKLYEEWIGDYFNFYGQEREYGVTLIANDDALSDKIFTNVEFEADSFTKTPTIIHNKIGFNVLTAHTPYQDTNPSLVPNFTKKFRIWRSVIPRAFAGVNQRDKDRIRNTNSTINFKYTPTSNSISNLGRTSLYNFSVIYYTK